MIAIVESATVHQLKQSNIVNRGTIGRQLIVQISNLHKRMISVGTDLTKSTTTWQQARPWHTEEGLSNLAKDNAKTMSDLFKGKKVAVLAYQLHSPGYAQTLTTRHTRRLQMILRKKV
jgi:hypothetical protein